MGVYLDYNASAPIDKRVLEKMIEVYQKYIGNVNVYVEKNFQNKELLLKKVYGSLVDVKNLN